MPAAMVQEDAGCTVLVTSRTGSNDASIRRCSYGKFYIWQAIAQGLLDNITVPALVMNGALSPGWQKTAVSALADLLPNATQATLDDETHGVSASL